MSIDASISAAAMAAFQAAADRAARGVRDPEAAKKACDRMDRRREDLRRNIGTLNVAIDLIRSGRNE